MVSINFVYNTLGLSMPLTESQEVSRNRHLNAVFELSLIYVFIFINVNHDFYNTLIYVTGDFLNSQNF